MAWATDQIFVAGGDFVTEHWPDFQRQTGIDAIITVAKDAPGVFANPAPWAWLWLPVEDEAGYRLDQLQMGVQFIEAALAGKRTVLLHGPQGVHRTRPLVAAYWLAQGKTLARVLREAQERPWLPPYKGEVSVLEQFLAAR